MSITETRNYTLKVGTSSESGNKCYQIINKEWGVVEIESYILPQALKYIDELESALNPTNSKVTPISSISKLN